MLTPTKEKRIYYGGDPEFFFEKGGRIIGSEKVVPQAGLKAKDGLGKPCVVQDGVQVELNPPARDTVHGFALNVQTAFGLINEELKNLPGVSCNFEGLVEVTQEEMDSLSPPSRILGCKPSKNIYGARPITIDPLTYRKRSAGGHEHFGLVYDWKLFQKRVDLIAICDIVVGNTMVMIDRDPGAAERRENYGRAGEYREPQYGVEYRTLSNSWLKNYTLLDLVYGLGAISVSILQDEKLVDELAAMVDIDKFSEAIDTNNFALARANFDTLRPFLAKNLPKEGFVLNPDNLDRFLTFAESVNAKGLENFFPETPMVHWLKGEFETLPKFLQRIY